MSASEYLRCAPKYTISRLNNQNFSGEGAQPPSPGEEGDTPSPHPTPLDTFGASLLAPSALVHPTQKSWLHPCRFGVKKLVALQQAQNIVGVRFVYEKF